MSKQVQDHVSEFTLENECKYWSLLAEANSMYLTISQRYESLMRGMETDGVAFKDIEKRMLNLAKENGLYTKTKGPWNPRDNAGNAELSYRPFKDMVKGKVNWAVQLSLYSAWQRRNWVSYKEETEEVVSVKKFKGKITLSVGGEEIECTITGLTASQFDLVEGKIKVVDEDKSLTPDELGELFVRNRDFIFSEIGNLAEKENIVPVYNTLVSDLSPSHVIN